MKQFLKRITRIKTIWLGNWFVIEVSERAFRSQIELLLETSAQSSALFFMIQTNLSHSVIRCFSFPLSRRSLNGEILFFRSFKSLNGNQHKLKAIILRTKLIKEDSLIISSFCINQSEWEEIFEWIIKENVTTTSTL